MDEKEKIAGKETNEKNDESNNSKTNLLIDSIDNGIEEEINIVKSNINPAKEEKILEKKIEKQFKASAIKYTMEIPGKKHKSLKLYGITDYDEHTLTFCGEPKRISNEVYFVDVAKQKFSVKSVRLNQIMDITIEGTSYPIKVTIVDYEIDNAE